MPIVWFAFSVDGAPAIGLSAADETLLCKLSQLVDTFSTLVTRSGLTHTCYLWYDSVVLLLVALKYGSVVVVTAW